MAIKIPIVFSRVVDEDNRPMRAWYDFWESLGVNSGLLASLPQHKIWIGDATATAVAKAISGDFTLTSAGLAQLVATSNTAEIAQDAVGGILTDTATIDFTYNDGVPTITADVVDGSINSAKLGSAWTTFTPSRTGWTDVGAPTVTGRKCRIGNVEYFQVKVVPNTSIATVAGTSYITLPETAVGIGGDASMQNITANTAVGSCVIDQTNSRVYVPSQVAAADTFTICGWFER